MRTVQSFHGKGKWDLYEHISCCIFEGQKYNEIPIQQTNTFSCLSFQICLVENLWIYLC